MATLTVTRDDGKDDYYQYYKDSVFMVQTGKGDKGSYRTEAGWKVQGVGTAGCRGRINSLFMHYLGINVHSGYKKRFIIVHKGGARVVVSRVLSIP